MLWKNKQVKLRILLAVFWMLCGMYFSIISVHASAIEGIYLIGGGDAYLEIKRRSFKEQTSNLINKLSLYLFEEKQTREEALYNSPRGGYSISGSFLPKKNNLSITRLNNNLIIASPEHPTEKNIYKTYIELAPSPKIRGDWDLVKINYLFLADPLDAFPDGSDRTPLGTLITLPNPVSSFLHRVDDKRIIEYFEEIEDNMQSRSNDSRSYSVPRATPRLLELANALAARFPDDIFVHTIYLDSLIIQRDYKALAVELDRWRISYQQTDNPFLQNVLKRCELALYAYSLSESGQNGYDFMEKLLSPQTDLDTRLRILPDILSYKEYVCPIQTLILRFNYTPNFLSDQVAAKVFCTNAIFLMLQGKNEEALLSLAGTYRMGQFLKQDYTLISNLIGIAVQMIACMGLELYILNACNTPEDFQRLWKIFAELDRLPHAVDLERTLTMLNPLLSVVTFWKKNMSSVRDEVSVAKYQLLKVAAAARHHLLTHNTFPDEDKKFLPYLPDGLPRDPFSSQPLKYLSGADLFTCYSIGPDETDDKAAIAYDPSNGSVSSGDIFIKVPRERKYPIPREGISADTAEELRKQFPEGLPSDHFATPRGKPLSISNTTPVYIYSYGPDVSGGVDDEYTPLVRYDPTNGAVSGGDLFIAVPPGIKQQKN